MQPKANLLGQGGLQAGLGDRTAVQERLENLRRRGAEQGRRRLKVPGGAGPGTGAGAAWGRAHTPAPARKSGYGSASSLTHVRYASPRPNDGGSPPDKVLMPRPKDRPRSACPKRRPSVSPLGPQAARPRLRAKIRLSAHRLMSDFGSKNGSGEARSGGLRRGERDRT